MERARWLALALCSIPCLTWVAASPGASAQTASSPGADCAPLPDRKPGSWAVIQRANGSKVKTTVTGVTDTQILLKHESLSGNNLDNGDDATTLDLNLLDGPSAVNPSVTLSYSPNLGTFRFPLCVGDSHEAPVNWQSPKLSGVFTMKSKVAAREKVHTAAGDFDAFRVDWQMGSQGGSQWYAPSIQRIVKFEGKTGGYELVQYGDP